MKILFKALGYASHAEVHPQLTTDPYNKRGQVGEIINYHPKEHVVTLKFDDGSQGLYQSTALIYKVDLKLEKIEF